MNVRSALFSSLALLLGSGVAGPAAALTCYSVLDRNDNVIYRDTYPPVDLSDQGAADRERMRRRGEHLLAMESDRCPTLEFFLGNAGSPNLNVDDVLGGMQVRSATSVSGVGATPSTGVTGASGSGRTTAAPAKAPAKPAAGSGSARKY